MSGSSTVFDNLEVRAKTAPTDSIIRPYFYT
jgi:hypothetical protein